MLNHIYGVVGVIGTLATLLATYLTNKDLSQWILIASGWIAALLTGYFNYLAIKKLSQSTDTHASKACELTNELTLMTQQKESLQNIADYLAKNNPQHIATPRTTVRQDSGE